MPTLLWRRRTSTPLFPGAWPNSSTSDHSDDQRLPVYNDDAPPQLPELRHLGSRKDGLSSHNEDDPVALAEEGWGFSVVSEHHGFEDNGRVVGARDRARHGSQTVSMSSPASTNAPLSASLSQASTFSDPTVSATVRNGIRRIYRLPRRIPRASLPRSRFKACSGFPRTQTRPSRRAPKTTSSPVPALSITPSTITSVTSMTLSRMTPL